MAVLSLKFNSEMLYLLVTVFHAVNWFTIFIPAAVQQKKKKKKKH